MPTCCNYPYWDYKHRRFRNLSFTLTEPSPPKHNRAWECKTHTYPAIFLFSGERLLNELKIFHWKCQNCFVVIRIKVLLNSLKHIKEKWLKCTLTEHHNMKRVSFHMTVECIHFRISTVIFKPVAWIWPTWMRPNSWTSAKKTTWGCPVNRRQAWFAEVSFALLARTYVYQWNSTWSSSYTCSLLNRLYSRVGMSRITFVSCILRVIMLVFSL